MNAVSYRMKQQNLVRSKTQGFLKNYQQSSARANSKSSLHNFAQTTYSSRQNVDISPHKTASKSVLFPLLRFDNPEMSKSQMVKGLNMRASHICNYSDVNTQLLQDKKQLEDRIAFLKDEIVREQKALGRAEMANRKIANELEKLNNSKKELGIRSDRLNEGITQARQDCFQLKNDLLALRTQNAETNKNINDQRLRCEQLQNENKVLKGTLLTEDKARNDKKADLIRRQKVMNSCSVVVKDKENERAVLLLEINNSVSLNKLQ